MDSFSVLHIQATEVRATFEDWATWRMELLLWLPAAMRGAGTSTTRRARSWRQFIIIRYIFVSQADDVSFILELIARVAEDHPAADANNVNLIGTSNGAAIIYRLLIATGIDRPFHRWFSMNGYGNIHLILRVFPMVSSMISVQWRDGSFWKAPDTMSNDYTIQTVPEFADNFEYYHFHGHYRQQQSCNQ